MGAPRDRTIVRKPGRPSAGRQWLGVAILLAAIAAYEGLAQAGVPVRVWGGLSLFFVFVFVCIWAGFRAGIAGTILLTGYIAVVNFTNLSAAPKRPNDGWPAIVGTLFVYGLIAIVSGVVQAKLLAARTRAFTAQETAESEAELRQLIVDSAMDAVVAMRDDGHISLWNPAAETTFGWTAEEVMDKPLAEVIIPERYREAHWRGLEKYKETGEGAILRERIELSALHRDGREFDAELTITPHQMGEGHFFVGFVRDITDRKRAEEALQQLNVDLENRVAERTSQLERVNSDLKREISHRVKAEETLRKNRQELQDFIDSMSTLNAKVAPDGTMMLVNRAALKASGLGLEELMKTNFLEGEWWSFDPEVQARVKAAFRRAAEGEPVVYEENAFVFGKVLTINFSLIPVKDTEGQVRYIVAEGTDVSALKEAEQVLHERSVQLEAANKELEAFSHSVSHDLRAPLRSLDGFSLALMEDYDHKLDETGKDYLRRVRSASQRMAQLIDDLLNLSRVTRAEMKKQRVSLSSQATAIASELKRTSPERRADFKIASGLTTEGDSRLLRIMLQNLLENAWKFTAKSRRIPCIEFGETETERGRTFYVRDNGAGFDMAYAGRLFGAFQRLHAASDFPGTGIGLATVARIVQRHGGQIWAEGKEGEGATFYFTLEPQPEAAQKTEAAA